MISIIIPCHNDGRYLLDAVRSAREQTCSRKEIIVVDDCSDDAATIEIMKHLGEVRVISLPHRQGPSAARNAGIAVARGEYILPLDADDMIAPTYAEKAVSVLRENPDIGICYCRIKLFGLKRGQLALPPFSTDKLLFDNMIASCALFRKADWQAAGGYDTALDIALEDYGLWLKIIHGGRRAHRLEEELFFYRIRPGSRSTALARTSTLRDCIKSLYRSCPSFFDERACALLVRSHELQHERAQLKCLWSFRLLSPFFRLEKMMRSRIKHLLSRTK